MSYFLHRSLAHSTAFTTKSIRAFAYTVQLVCGSSSLPRGPACTHINNQTIFEIACDRALNLGSGWSVSIRARATARDDAVSRARKNLWHRNWSLRISRFTLAHPHMQKPRDKRRDAMRCVYYSMFIQEYISVYDIIMMVVMLMLMMTLTEHIRTDYLYDEVYVCGYFFCCIVVAVIAA